MKIVVNVSSLEGSFSFLVRSVSKNSSCIVAEVVIAVFNYRCFSPCYNNKPFLFFVGVWSSLSSNLLFNQPALLILRLFLLNHKFSWVEIVGFPVYLLLAISGVVICPCFVVQSTTHITKYLISVSQ